VDLRAELTGRILGLPGVEVRRSRFTGDEAFFAGRREIAHFHGNRVLDIRLTRARIRELPADRRVTLRGTSDWCEFAFTRREDLDRAAELVAAAATADRRGRGSPRRRGS
jgi:hypothetical protein